MFRYLSLRSIGSKRSKPSHSHNQGTLKDMVYSIMQRASAYTRIPSTFIQGLKNCSHILQINFPLIRDDNTIQILRAFRAHHSIHSLPMKGGVRFKQNMTLDQVQGLAANMTLKMACVDIPYGGAHGGVSVDPNSLSFEELQRVTRRYAKELQISSFMGPALDVPGPDMGSNSTMMAWMMDEYVNLRPDDTQSQACISGKPQEIGGIRGRKQATGLGFFFALKAFLEDRDLQEMTGLSPDLKGTSFVIEGFGNVGQHIAKYIFAEGGKIIGIAQWDGATYNPDGLDIFQLQKHYSRHHTVKGFDGGQTSSRQDQVRTRECDIFIPAAVQTTINMGNVSKFNCKLVAQAANQPVTPKAEEFLMKHGVFLLPDIIMNAGGVVSSYFEYVKNVGHISPGKLTRRWEQKSNEAVIEYIEQLIGNSMAGTSEGQTDQQLLQTALEDSMHSSVNATIKTSRNFAIGYRDAAYVNGMNRVYENLRFSSYYSA